MRSGERQAAWFTVTPASNAAPGAYDLRAEAVFDGRTHGLAQRVIAYPHIQSHRLYAPARATARVLDVRVAPVRVGYVMGAGDQVPEAISRLGLEVTLLTDDQLASADLAAYDVIVIGIRASEGRPGIRREQRAAAGLRARRRHAHRPVSAAGLRGPRARPVQGRDGPRRPRHRRTCAGDSPAIRRIPLFTFPNRITDEDWAGWVQERNLYAFSTIGPELTPLLETADPNEPPQRGGQVYARLGKGQFVYTSYAWFRQLPAGVPGAYRLFANLLSLPKAPAK